MKKGIDLLLIVVLLVTIGVLLYFGMGSGNTIELTSSGTTVTFTLTVPDTVTSLPTNVKTATLMPASVTIPTKTVTHGPRASATSTKTPTATYTETSSNTTPISSLNQEINTGIERGNHIIQAIEAYHTSKGAYPPTLADLSPTYLNELPVTSTGQAYFYRIFDASSPLAADVYWVSFRAINQDHVACTYFRRLDYWDCNYVSP